MSRVNPGFPFSLMAKKFHFFFLSKKKTLPKAAIKCYKFAYVVKLIFEKMWIVVCICTETSLVKRMELRFGYSDSAASDLVPGCGFTQLSM